MNKSSLYILASVFLGVMFALFLWANPVHYLILFFGISGCILSFAKPQLGIMWFLCIIPYIGFFKRIEYYYTGNASAEYNNVLSLMPELLVLTLVIIIIIDSKRNNTAFLIKNPLPIAVLFFISICFIQIFNPKSTLIIGLYGFKNFGMHAFSFFVALYFLRTREDIRIFLNITLINATIIASYGLWQQLFGVPMWDKVWVEDFFFLESDIFMYIGTEFTWKNMRKFSLMVTPVSTACFYVIAIMLSLTLRRSYSFKLRTLVNIAILLMIPALFFTYIRGCWVAMAVGLLVLYFLQWVSLIRKNVSLMSLFILVTLFAITQIFPFSNISLIEKLNPLIAERIYSLTNPMSDSAMVARFSIWKYVISLASSNPLGFGIGSTGSTQSRMLQSGEALIVDNLFMKIIYELGWIGFIVFLVILIIVVRETLIHRHIKDSYSRSIRIAILTTIAAIMTEGLVAPILEYPCIAKYFWLLLGIFYNLKYINKTENSLHIR